MHILYIVGRELNYTRNDVLLRAFCRLGNVDVIGDNKPGSLLLRNVRVFFRALPYIFDSKNKYDLVFVGFYGHLLMLPIGLISQAPILFDAFVSTYDTLTNDRGYFSSHSLPGLLAFYLDKYACNLADTILLDTVSHVEYFCNTFSIPNQKIKSLPVGCNDDIFFPRPKNKSNSILTVLYYSTYLPLHGVDVVIKAAKLLQNEHGLRFRLIGTGQEYKRVYNLAVKLNLKNIDFIPIIPISKLAEEISSADICLGGHFGVSDKSKRVIPGKIYQILAMQRPLIATDTPANLELLKDGETAILCSPNDPEGLASAILKLKSDPQLRVKISITGRNLYLNNCSENIITIRLKKIIENMLAS